VAFGYSDQTDSSGLSTWLLIGFGLIIAFLVSHMKGRFYSRWLAPWIGAFFCTLIGFKETANDPNPWPWIGMLTIFGFVCGCFICLLDPKQSGKQKGGSPEDPDQEAESTQANRGSLVGRSLAVLTLIVFYIPFLSLVMGIVAICLNWRCGGWPRIVSVLGAAMALCVSALVLIQLV
jgi:hypothetical protein